MLAISVWLAIRDAIAGVSGGQRTVDLDAPATPERILTAVADQRRHVSKDA